MRLKTLHMENFGPCKGTAKYTFPESGLIAVTGPNGKGKSHILAAVEFALMGEVDGVQNCMLVHGVGGVRDEKGSIPSAVVELEAVTADGREFKIRRTLSIDESDATDLETVRRRIRAGEVLKTKHTPTLSINGAPSIRGAAKIDTSMSELLGLSEVGIETILVRQRRAGTVFDAVDSERIAEINRLAGVHRCERALQTASALLATIQVVDRTKELGEAGLEKADAESRLSAAEAKLAEFPGGPEGIKNALAASQTRFQALQAGIARRRSAELALGSAKARFDEAVRQQVAIPPVVGEPPVCAVTFEAYQQAKNALVTANTLRVSAKAYADALQTRDALIKEVSGWEPLKGPAEATIVAAKAEIDRLNAKMGELTVEQRENTKFLSAFRSGVCPTCGRALEDQKQVEACAAREPQILQEMAEAQTAIQYQRTIMAGAEQTVNTANNVLRRATEALPKLAEVLHTPVLAMPAEEEASYAQAVQAYEVYQQALTRFDAAGKQIVEARARAEAAVKAAQDLVAASEAEYATAFSEPAADASELERLQQEINTAVSNLEAVSTAAGSVEAIRQQLKAVIDRIHGFEDEQIQNARKLQAVNFLNRIKTVCHKTALPMDMARAYVADMNARMSRWADTLHAPFLLFIEPSTYRFFYTMNGTTLPVKSLSGGQKTIAAWIWHMALREKHSAGIQLFMMDEPTDGLDSANLTYVGEVLEQLARTCEGTANQLVFVTHEFSLADRFTSRITL